MDKHILWLAVVAVSLCVGTVSAQNADTVDGFHAYGTPHANALLALNGSARMSGDVIANDSIPGSRLVPGGVTAGRLGNNSVTTEKITDGQVMEADLAAGAVTSSKIASGSVGVSKIADGAVTGAKIANSTIEGSDLKLPLTALGPISGGAVVTLQNSSSIAGSTGVLGYASASSGQSYGVVGKSGGPSGVGVQGWATALTGNTRGVYGRADSASGQAVRGWATALTGNTYGVWGQSKSDSGYGVMGHADSATGGTYGVWGQSDSSSGSGVRGHAGSTTGLTCGISGTCESSSGRAVAGYANSPTGTTYALYGDASSADGYGICSFGDCKVVGDLTVTGSKTGYIVDIVMNGSEEPLEPGDLVEIVSYAEPVVGRIPVGVVRKTRAALSAAVIGPVDSAVSLTPSDNFGTSPAAERDPAPFEVKWVAGAIAPRSYGRVVALGFYERVKVDASYGPIYPGDLLVSSPTPGYAMACDDPGVGTVVGKALGSLESGMGEIPVFVSSK